jgi:hypothetical protein
VLRFAPLVEGIQAIFQRARALDVASHGMAPDPVDAAVLQLETIQGFSRIVRGREQFVAVHPLRLIVQDMLPGRLDEQLTMLFQGASE